MYRIKAVTRANNELLTDNYGSKEKIIKESVISLATEIHKEKLFDLEEERLLTEFSTGIHPVTEFRSEVFVMKREELKRAMEIVDVIEQLVGPGAAQYAEELRKLLTEAS